MRSFAFISAAALMQSILAAANWSGPSAAINWAPSNRVRVYGLDPNGYINEWSQNDSGIGYNGPHQFGPQATPGTDLTAIYTENSGATTAPTIRVLFWDPNGRYHEWLYTDAQGWHDGGVLP